MTMTSLMDTSLSLMSFMTGDQEGKLKTIIKLKLVFAVVRQHEQRNIPVAKFFVLSRVLLGFVHFLSDFGKPTTGFQFDSFATTITAPVSLHVLNAH
jgi:hypothetical protein